MDRLHLYNTLVMTKRFEKKTPQYRLTPSKLINVT